MDEICTVGSVDPICKYHGLLYQASICASIEQQGKS